MNTSGLSRTSELAPMLPTIISQLEAFFLLEDAARIIEIAGPKVGVAIIILLVIAALTVTIWRSISAERRLKIQFAHQQETNRVALDKARLELDSARQKSDATETSSLHKILDKFVDIQTDNQHLMAEQISSRNDLQTMLKTLNTKTENFGNWMALASESSEAFQAWARGQVTAAEQRGTETRKLLEPLPFKLDTVLEAATAAKDAAKKAESGIQAVGTNVNDAISKLAAIETLLYMVESSVSVIKSTLIEAATKPESLEPPPIPELVAAIVEPQPAEAAPKTPAVQPGTESGA